MKTTAEKIDALVSRGMTATEIARATGVPQPTVWRIHRRIHRNPVESTAMAIDRLYVAHEGVNGEAVA